MADVGWRMGADLQPGDLVEVRLDAVVNDYDFEAKLVRQVSIAPGKRQGQPRTLPVMSSAGAFGR
jgi:hypothetical protein